MCNVADKTKFAHGFSLAEVVVVLTMGAMILAGALGIYRRVEYSVDKVTKNIESVRLPSEVLQRIAEDLDDVIASDSDTQVTIENTIMHGFPSARLKITRTYKDSKDVEQTFEEIIWQSGYDYESVDGGLILYRHHSGIGMEDKILDRDKEVWERELFIPICSGMTLFEVSAVSGQEILYKWSGPLPTGISISLSFANVEKDNETDKPDKNIYTRIIAVDRTRKIRFEIEQAGESNKDNEENIEDTDSSGDSIFNLDDKDDTEKDK